LACKTRDRALALVRRNSDIGALGFFVHAHPSFQIDGTFGFYAWFGLVVCVGMVLFAKALGIFLKRKETYYDDE
jgi:hypothetical protein